MAHRDTAWIEAQYNNRARVPDSLDILARWRQASALARSRMTVTLDLPYGNENDADGQLADGQHADAPGQTLDVFPARSPGSPVLVYIHGGWWRSLDKADHSFVAPAFVQAGAMVVVPNYALCPAVTIEQIALQAARAVAWTWRHAAGFGGDPSRIHAVGHSAGGHLAAMLLCCDWPKVGADLPPQLLASALSISGVFDLAPLRRAPFLQRDLRLSQSAVQRLSPAYFPAPAGTLRALVGADESAEFLRQNRLIRSRWGPAAVPVCEALPGLNHFTVLHDLVDPAGRAHRHAMDLLGLSGA